MKLFFSDVKGSLVPRPIVFILFICAFPLQARSATHYGTDFWLAFPDVAGRTSVTLEVLISSPFATSGVVSVPGIGFSAPFAVAAGGSTSVAVTLAAKVIGLDTISNLGVNVTSLQDVSVYMFNNDPTASDGYLGLPVASLGTSYMVSSYPSLGFTSFASRFVLVGTQNGTQVTITPSVTTGIRAGGVPYTITLNRGDTYILTNNVTGSDLTGTLVTSTQPLALIGGAEASNVPSASGAANPLMEQQWPLSDWGAEFVAFPLASRTGGDVFRFLAQANGTTVNVNGVVVATLNAGQVYEGVFTGPSHITSNNPIYVDQFSQGGSVDGNLASDPCMISIPPLSAFLSDYLPVVPSGGFTSNYENVFVPTSAVGTVTLDGVPIPAASFVAVGTSGYSAAAVPVSGGVHRLTGPVSFGVIVYGFGPAADAYGYPAGLFTVPVATMTPTPTPSFTPTFTLTYTPTPTPSHTPTFTRTITSTPTFTPSFTPTATPSCVPNVWPNPFNPKYAKDKKLKIGCLMPGSEVDFYTLSGEKVRTIRFSFYQYGSYFTATWDGKNENGVPVSTGVYYYVIHKGDEVFHRGKVIVMADG